MTSRDHPPWGVDTATPNVARMYDYFLGGKDNFAADRDAAEQLMAAMPEIPAIARSNREFLGRAVTFLTADAGIRQFLDIGTGLPTQDNVHTVAQRIAPDVRVAYVDNDPVVCSHGHALLARAGEASMVEADLRKPEEILGHPAIRNMIDFGKPLALLCTGTLHFLPDDLEPRRIVASLRDAMVPGSYLVISHATREDTRTGDEEKAALTATVYSRASAQLLLRPPGEVLRFFDGFDLLEPGLVRISQWRPEPSRQSPDALDQTLRTLRGGVGRKI